MAASVQPGPASPWSSTTGKQLVSRSPSSSLSSITPRPAALTPIQPRRDKAVEKSTAPMTAEKIGMVRVGVARFAGCACLRFVAVAR